MKKRKGKSLRSRNKRKSLKKTKRNQSRRKKLKGGIKSLFSYKYIKVAIDDKEYYIIQKQDEQKSVLGGKFSSGSYSVYFIPIDFFDDSPITKKALEKNKIVINFGDTIFGKIQSYFNTTEFYFKSEPNKYKIISFPTFTSNLTKFKTSDNVKKFITTIGKKDYIFYHNFDSKILNFYIYDNYFMKYTEFIDYCIYHSILYMDISGEFIKKLTSLQYILYYVWNGTVHNNCNNNKYIGNVNDMTINKNVNEEINIMISSLKELVNKFTTDSREYQNTINNCYEQLKTEFINNLYLVYHEDDIKNEINDIKSNIQEIIKLLNNNSVTEETFGFSIEDDIKIKFNINDKVSKLKKKELIKKKKKKPRKKIMFDDSKLEETVTFDIDHKVSTLRKNNLMFDDSKLEKTV